MSASNSLLQNPTTRTILFMVILSLICATILSILASALRQPQEIAKDLDRSKQMLIAAQIISPYGFFQVQTPNGELIPAKYVEGGSLEPSEEKVPATQEQVLEIYRQRIQPFLVNDKGELKTFEEVGLDEKEYVNSYKKTGYYKQPWKLIYKILPNKTTQQSTAESKQVDGYVIPVNGMGLWDAIYGYLALKPDGNTVIGISWYDQKETPGLGANIAEPAWQSQFPGKRVFQPSNNGQTDYANASLGINVLKGKVSEVLGNSPRALSAVDGMAGATLTGNGVASAYKDVLAAYRPFLLKIHKENTQEPAS